MSEPMPTRTPRSWPVSNGLQNPFKTGQNVAGIAVITILSVSTCNEAAECHELLCPFNNGGGRQLAGCCPDLNLMGVNAQWKFSTIMMSLELESRWT
jgi:hypothetical protein